LYSTVSYLSRNAGFKQVNPDIPITQSIPDADTPEVFAG
jgi:mediator of RNA polymerase II transcription subunit 21